MCVRAYAHAFVCVRACLCVFMCAYVFVKMCVSISGSPFLNVTSKVILHSLTVKRGIARERVKSKSVRVCVCM